MRTDLLGLAFGELTRPADRETDLASVEDLVAERIGRYSVENRLLTASNAFVWINFSASLVDGPGGRADHLIAHIEDIAARKRMQAELQRLAEHDRTARRSNARRGVWSYARSRLALA